jgi:hypothetical protein
MSIEGTVALASLAAAITTVLIATNIVAVPESLAFISTIVNPIGIAVLFIAAIYFATLAYCSYKQMHKNEEIGEAKTSRGAGEFEAKIADLATKTELSTKADKTEVEVKIAGLTSKADLSAKAGKTEVVPTVLKLSENDVKQLKQILGLQEQVT